MRLKIFILITIFCAAATLATAQNTTSGLRFSSDTIHLGTIAEDGGSVVALAEATNESAIPMYIDDIVTSCGCTSVGYPREAIAPHQSATIAITFNPLNRPGRFEKEILVKIRDAERDIVLHITGYVQPRERTIDEIYPFDMGGGLRLNATSRAFGYLEQGKEATEHIEFINTSSERITLAIERTHSSGILTTTLPAIIEPNATGEITLRYTLTESSDIYGTQSDEFYLVVDGTRSRYRLTTEVIAVDNFDIVDDISAPRCDISKNIIKFGEVNSPNGVLRESITLRNEGGSPLLIRAVESSSKAVVCDILGARSIAPGDVLQLAITLNCNEIANPDELFTARIRIITSDPLRPMQSIKVTAIPMW